MKGRLIHVITYDGGKNVQTSKEQNFASTIAFWLKEVDPQD